MNIIYSTFLILAIHRISIEFEDMNANAHPLILGEGSDTEVYNFSFIKCSMNDEQGTAIKISTGRNLNAHDCNFIDCKDLGSSLYCPIIFSYSFSGLMANRR